MELVGSTSGRGVDLPCVGPVSAARSDLHQPKPERQLVPSSPTGQWHVCISGLFQGPSLV